MNNVGVGRMSADKIDSRIRYGIKMASIAESEIDVPGGIRMLEVGFFLTASDSSRVDINADGISSEEFGLNERGATSGKLVQNEIAGLRVAENKIAGDVGRPIAAPFGVVGGPIAALGKAPNGGHF